MQACVFCWYQLSDLMTNFNSRGWNRANWLCHSGFTGVISNKGVICMGSVHWLLTFIWGLLEKGERKDLPFACCVPGILIQSDFIPVITQWVGFIILIFQIWKLLSLRDIKWPAQGLPVARSGSMMRTRNPCAFHSPGSHLSTRPLPLAPGAQRSSN